VFKNTNLYFWVGENTNLYFRVIDNKVREMKNSSEVFKSNFYYYQRIAHKKVILEKCSFRFSHISYIHIHTQLDEIYRLVRDLTIFRKKNFLTFFDQGGTLTKKIDQNFFFKYGHITHQSTDLVELSMNTLNP
jgi:hypothetical protein